MTQVANQNAAEEAGLNSEGTGLTPKSTQLTPESPYLTPEAAFEQCLSITRREAKNFYYGIRLLRPPKRNAMAALYALARRIDDICDGTADNPATADNSVTPVNPADKRAQLENLRTEIHHISQHRQPTQTQDPVLAGVAHAARNFPIPTDAFTEIIDGCLMDIDHASYGTIDDTVTYCRLVAGSVGRLSLGVFGCDDPDLCPRLADDLGVALQLTNILRDIKEDAAMGRVYLPAEDISRFGCAADLSGPRDNVVQLVLHEADRAEEWFERGFELLWHLDRRSRACVSAMSGIYYRLLQRIRRQPEAVLDGRVSVPVWEKSWVALKSLAGFRP